jgi:hypothetical protein
LGQFLLTSVEGLFLDLRLIEMKDNEEGHPERLASWFSFSGQPSASTIWHGHWEIATLFAFIVLNSANEYGRPFAVLLTLEEVESTNAEASHSVSGQLP